MRACCQGWAWDPAGLGSAGCGHAPPWARLCPLPAVLQGEPRMPAQACSFPLLMLGPRPLLRPSPGGRVLQGCPKQPAWPRRGVWPMPRLYAPSDVFFSVKSPLAFMLNANVDCLHQEKWAIARKKMSFLKRELPLKYPSSAPQRKQRQGQAGRERSLSRLPCLGPGAKPRSAWSDGSWSLGKSSLGPEGL